MKLPNAHLAIVDRSKVVDYLLNEAHPDNGGKARFFRSLGYSREDQGKLKRAGCGRSGPFGSSTAEDAPRLVTAYPGRE